MDRCGVGATTVTVNWATVRQGPVTFPSRLGLRAASDTISGGSVLENVSMRQRKVTSAATISRRRRSLPVDLTSFGARPTSRAGEFLGDRYRIEGLLGTGGTSNVYLALDTQIGNNVVVKQLNREGADNEGIRERFLEEAEALSNFQHPRILHVVDFAEPGSGPPYLVTEALVGETLASLLRREPLLPISITQMIARQTAEGLSAVHARGLVHRDIKPGNLFLLGRAGSPFGLKIIDFGMAKLSDSNDVSGVQTVLGTIEYMAPEQTMADLVDGRTDIYSFGVMLFRLLTGRLPFQAAEGLDLLGHQLFSSVPAPSSFHSSIEPHMDAIVARATRKHPDNRYPDAHAMMIDLDVVFGQSFGEPSHADLVVDPDVYRPQNQKGREVAELLAERWATLAPIGNGQFERDAARSLAHPKILVPDAADSADFEPLSDDALEICEG
jgi:serine/threonine protein kinase